MKKWIKSIFSAEPGSVSSKRLMGVLAWLTVLACYIHCTINNIQLPECTDFIVTTASAMLGIDSIAGIFKKREDIRHDPIQ
jgi:hypothetical protein